MAHEDSNFRKLRSSRRIKALVLSALAVFVVNAAEAMTFGDGLQWSDAIYSTTVSFRDVIGGDLTTEQADGTAGWLAPNTPENQPAVAVLHEPRGANGQFLVPVNSTLGAFASATNDSSGSMEVGVSGMLGTPGILIARANYRYTIENTGTNPTLLIGIATVPGIEVSLAGTQFQQGRVGELQNARVQTKLETTIRGSRGTIFDTEYDFSANVEKRSPVVGDPSGFSFDWSNDLLAIMDSFNPQLAPKILINVVGEFDVGTLQIPEFRRAVDIDTLLPGDSIDFNFETIALLSVPFLAPENGGQARIGDPLALSPSGPAFQFTGDLAAPVPIPAGLWLLLSGLVGISRISSYVRQA